MPKGVRTPVETVQEILVRFDVKRRERTYDRREGGERNKRVMECVDEIAHEMDMPALTVHSIIRRFQPTTNMARMYLKAKAIKLAHRIVRKASPAEAMELLSRPGMDVIAPAKKQLEGGGGGFFLSINAQDCGAVKVGVMQAPQKAEIAEESASFDPFDLQPGDYNEVRNEISPKTPLVLKESVIEKARRKIADARAAATVGSGDGRANHQGSDGV